MSFSQTNWQINLGRLLNGFGAGMLIDCISNIVNELAPLNHRGLLGSLDAIQLCRLGYLLLKLCHTFTPMISNGD